MKIDNNGIVESIVVNDSQYAWHNRNNKENINNRN
jgi:hypothetical protein